MGNVDDISQLCRLCLVKDQVNIPIFEESSDIGQTFLKINSCLPVKVSRDDNLPKKICDGCSYKLDMLYTFRNTSADSEKQLISWLNQAGLGTITQTALKDPLANAKPEITVKQETFDTVDNRTENENQEMGVDAQTYMIQQQLPYEQEFEFGEPSGSGDEMPEEPAPKRLKRAAALKKAPLEETDDAEDDLERAMQITKAEDEDSEDVDQPDYVEAPSTSADDQPGPSGVGKTAVEAPSMDNLEDVNYLCNICSKEFVDKKSYLQHHMRKERNRLQCCKCYSTFKTARELYSHLDHHTSEPVSVSDEDETVEEIVLDYEKEETGNNDSELFYILDDSQCVNEIVIEEDHSVEKEKTKPSENFAIVQLEHGYVIPNVTEEESESPVILTGKHKIVEASTSEVIRQTKPRAPQPKRRHVVPDFSAANYVFVSANEEIDVPHYKCLRCEQLFISKFVFFRHVEKGKCYINNCDVCNATFVKNSDFYSHYTLHHTDRAVCNFCFRTFMYEKNVKEHMMRHLDQFRHRCDECQKGFYTVREYRNHYKNRHMGIRYRCEVCNRSFADEYYFKRHIATHESSTVVLE